MNTAIKEFIPPIIISILRKMKVDQWRGNYLNWEEASSLSSGYDSEQILSKVKNAILQVRDGKAAFERDSVLFDTIEYSYPLLSSLLLAAAVNGGKLNVVDFGGSLGSTYFQNKTIFDKLPEVAWNVIEQPLFVKEGKSTFQDERLKFFYTLEEYLQTGAQADILLISCTLPYLQKPYEMLSRLLEGDFRFVIIDNTPYNIEDKDRLVIQRVPPSIYPATMPAWLLTYKKIKHIIEEKYNLIAEYDNESFIYVDGTKIKYRGLFAETKKRK
jgi:putative methyltransferase (TIGR04325 family)